MQLHRLKMETTIRLNLRTKSELERFRQYRGESYESW